ncbi:hypothetical protein VTI74DRAFT_4561 [Chaetomium olivicolor]
MKSLSSILVLGLAASGALAINFAASCDTNSIKVSGRTLTARGKNIWGQYTCSKLDLNRCIKNRYGTLQSDPAGAGPHIGDECINCTNGKPENGLAIDGGPSLMYCQCNPGTGAARENWPTAIFDLNTVVDNNNGNLEYYSNKAAAC